MADCIAAVQLATQSWLGSGRVAGQLPTDADKNLYLLGCRLLHSVDYCERNEIPVGGLLRQIGSAAKNEQQWHAESHLFVQARLHGGAVGSRLAHLVTPIAEGTESAPDIGIDRVGLEIRTRSPGTTTVDETALLSFLRGAIEHAAEKVSARWPRVIALVDYSPRVIMGGDDIFALLWQKTGFFRPRLEQLLRDFPQVPALIHTATTLTIVELPDGQLATQPVFGSSIEWNPSSPPLPAAHRQLLDGTFGDDWRTERMLTYI